MAERHTPSERLQLFRVGWRRGAGMKAIPDLHRGDCDFQRGYREGRHAYAEAMRIAREHYGTPPPSVLRIPSTAGPIIHHEFDVNYVGTPLVDETEG